MRSADPLDQLQLERLELARGRPLDSPHWSMLVAVKTASATSQRTGERTTVVKGQTFVSRDYWVAKAYSEWFQQPRPGTALSTISPPDSERAVEQARSAWAAHLRHGPPEGAQALDPPGEGRRDGLLALRRSDRPEHAVGSRPRR
jgi:hypothetical protein